MRLTHVLAATFGAVILAAAPLTAAQQASAAPTSVQSRADASSHGTKADIVKTVRFRGTIVTATEDALKVRLGVPCPKYSPVGCPTTGARIREVNLTPQTVVVVSGQPATTKDLYPSMAVRVVATRTHVLARCVPGHPNPSPLCTGWSYTATKVVAAKPIMR